MIANDLFYVWRKEVVIGIINGIALDLLISIIAWTWQGNGWLGLVVGMARSAIFLSNKNTRLETVTPNQGWSVLPDHQFRQKTGNALRVVPVVAAG